MLEWRDGEPFAAHRALQHKDTQHKRVGRDAFRVAAHP